MKRTTKTLCTVAAPLPAGTSLTATGTPVLVALVRYAARRVVHAVAEGRVEIAITPQARLAARAAELAPEITQRITGWINRFVLPSPALSR